MHTRYGDVVISTLGRVAWKLGNNNPGLKVNWSIYFVWVKYYSLLMFCAVWDFSNSNLRGLSNTPDPWRVVKLVTVRGGSWLLVTVCQFATCWRSRIIVCTYMNVCGIIILEWGILLHFFCLFICVVCKSSRPVTKLYPFWRPGQHAQHLVSVEALTYTSGVRCTCICLVWHYKKITSSPLMTLGPRDTPSKVGWGVWPTSWTLPLFMTKICDFLYSIEDLAKNLIPYLWPLHLAQLP